VSGIATGCVAYVAMGYLGIQAGAPDGDFSTLAGVRSLLQSANEPIHAACWIHYLAFDLALGLVETELAGPLGMPTFLLWATLPATLMLGPAGLLLFGVLAAANCAVAGRLDRITALFSYGADAKDKSE